MVETVDAVGESSARNPRTGLLLNPRPLGEGAPGLPLGLQLLGARSAGEHVASGDQRPKLADWLTAPDNR
jgi:hypothetical protein